MPWLEFLELWFYLSIVGIMILACLLLRSSISATQYRRGFEFNRDLAQELKEDNEEFMWLNEGNKKVIASYRSGKLKIEGSNYTNNFENS